MNIRTKLIQMATLTRDNSVQWSLQPDWKILEAALLYEDSSTRALTAGVNFLVYLRDSLGAVIDPHSHENGGYNYPDVAYLLDSLGVGGSTVIGGHIWDPSFPQFHDWARFRVPVKGEKYSQALWRGDILMGSATPGHVNDPVVSGLWRPEDPEHYWTDDPEGNIVAVGPFHNSMSGVRELVGLYASGGVDTSCLLTASWHITPASITADGGLAAIEDTIINPLVAMRDSGQVVLSDFTSLVSVWKTQFGAQACLYDPAGVEIDNSGPLSGAKRFLSIKCLPNPFISSVRIAVSVGSTVANQDIDVYIYSISGELIDKLMPYDSPLTGGIIWDASRISKGIYIVRARAGVETASKAIMLVR
jgi:hypothetical protein